MKKFTSDLSDPEARALLDHTVCVEPDRIKALWVMLMGWTVISSLIGLGFRSFAVFSLCEFSGAPVILLFLGAVHNFRVLWDEEGFTVTSVLGVRRRYTYQDITGMIRMGIGMELETADGRRLSLHCSLNNREAFYAAICRHRNDIPKIRERLLCMGHTNLAASYRSGVLREAMLIPKIGKYRASMEKYRRIASAIEIVSYFLAIVCVILIYCTSQYFWIIDEFVLGVLLCLSVYSLVLFIRYPQYYSARPKPSRSTVSMHESFRTYHKWSPMASSCYPAGFVSLFGLYLSWPSDILVLSISLGLIAGLLYFFLGKHYSREYQTYKVGLLNLVLESLCFGLGFMMFILQLRLTGGFLRLFLG